MPKLSITKYDFDTFLKHNLVDHHSRQKAIKTDTAMHNI
jgi:hypothetical protein